MLITVSRLFSKVGLNKKAADIYLYILSNSPVSLSQLQKRYKGSRLTLYVEQLIAIPLITFDLDRDRNTIYYALKPDTAFRAISDQLLWSHPTSTHPSEIPQKKKTGQLISTSNNVGQKLMPRYKRRSPIGLNSIRIARDPSQLATFLGETISLANYEILATSSSPLLPKIALIWNELQSRIQAGVKYKRIVSLWEMSYHGYEIKRRDVMEAGVDLRVIDKKRIDKKFYVIDDNYLVLFAPDMAKSGSFTLDGQVIKNKVLSRKYRKGFKALFQDSIPAKIILDYMELLKKDLLKRSLNTLDNTGVSWLKTLIDYGNFAEWPELPQTKKEIIIDIALKKNLVKKDSDFKMGVSPNYGWSLNDIREYQKAAQMSN